MAKRNMSGSAVFSSDVLSTASFKVYHNEAIMMEVMLIQIEISSQTKRLLMHIV